MASLSQRAVAHLIARDRTRTAARGTSVPGADASVQARCPSRRSSCWAPPRKFCWRSTGSLASVSAAPRCAAAHAHEARLGGWDLHGDETPRYGACPPARQAGGREGSKARGRIRAPLRALARLCARLQGQPPTQAQLACRASRAGAGWQAWAAGIAQHKRGARLRGPSSASAKTSTGARAAALSRACSVRALRCRGG